MRCKWRVDKKVGRYWLPGCMGGAVYGADGCTCPTAENESEDIEERVDRLEKQIKELIEKIEGPL